MQLVVINTFREPPSYENSINVVNDVSRAFNLFSQGGLPDTEQVKGMVSSLWLLGVCLGSYIGATIGSAVFDHFSFEESTFFECCLMAVNVRFF